MDQRTVTIKVTGLVQGVGFRPFVYRVALRNSLAGWIRNTNENVIISISGSTGSIENFVKSLKDEAPPAAVIENIFVADTDYDHSIGFTIRDSHDISDEVTEISPDISVCSECISDMRDHGRRFEYPFVNCTNCGPRFTIIEDLPYDRANTTMVSFGMCNDCIQEYKTITDRRFHAQPAACNICGPRYELFEKGKPVSGNISFITSRFSEIIKEGGIIMLKGLGGMHLACDAFNSIAVEKLRMLKKRDGKPFAVMFRGLESLRQYASVSKEEEESLLSWRKPIVILKAQPHTRPAIPVTLNSRLNLLGVMLPYMPVHYLLFDKLETNAIVMTSGNFSSEPILIGNSDATGQFSDIVDALLLHNRDICNRTDDSVVRIIRGKERVLRRSRGYVPSPVRTALNAEGIVAMGAELTNCFCAGKGDKAFLSQHIGDLQSLETTLFYEDTIDRFIKLFRIKPSLVATDLHPDYISTRSAKKFASLPIVRVQHHHAHIASCMAEHGLDEKVIGVSFDGTGYGTDGNIWGSEFMVCDLSDFKRISHFEYIPLPGGDSAIEEPWRIAVSWLYKVYGKDFIEMDLPLVEQAGREKIDIIIRMIERNINCPLTSGAGRLFDAVASMTGLVQTASFQAEGPMRLESLVTEGLSESYPFEGGPVIGLGSTIKAIAADVLACKSLMTIATKLHNTIILIIFDTVRKIRSEEGINKVALSGGVFQNKYLLSGTADLLEKDNFEVFTHASVPPNDGGIALGQLAVASKRRELKCV